MIALFVIIYVVAIWLVYVKMKIKPNPINLAIAASAGLLSVGLIFMLWQFSAPMSSQLVVNRYTIQIVPQVSGPISKIDAQPNAPLAKGKDLLFEIVPDTYQYTANELEASLAVAQKNREQLEAGTKVAAAAITESEAQLEKVKVELAMAQKTVELNAGAVSKLELSKLTQSTAAATATVTRTKAAKEQADRQLEAADGEIKSVAAKLDTARYNLSQCKVLAPADGFVTNWQVREGAMASPQAPLGTFIDTSQTNIVATFSQNTLKNVRPGDKVEFTFKTDPGNIHSGTVDAVIAASGEGQFVTAGQLISSEDIQPSGTLAVKFKMDDEQFAQSLPMGATGSVAIYTQSGKAFQVISTVTIRIKAWLSYLIPF